MAELGEAEASEASNTKGQDEGTMAHKSHLRARETGNERTPGQAAMDIANDSDPDTDAAEHDDDDEHYGDDADDEDDEDDEEPRLKYAYLTKQLQSVYRNGDATSSVLTAGDKMVRATTRYLWQMVMTDSTCADCRNSQWEYCEFLQHHHSGLKTDDRTARSLAAAPPTPAYLSRTFCKRDIHFSFALFSSAAEYQYASCE